MRTLLPFMMLAAIAAGPPVATPARHPEAEEDPEELAHRIRELANEGRIDEANALLAPLGLRIEPEPAPPLPPNPQEPTDAQLVAEAKRERRRARNLRREAIAA